MRPVRIHLDTSALDGAFTIELRGNFAGILAFSQTAREIPLAARASFSNRSDKRKRKNGDWAHDLSLASLQFLWFDRAAGFPSLRPQDRDADARRSCRGWPLHQRPPKAWP
jgi:hypothetical protein